MKKFLSYILIVFVFANFLAPISIGISRENHKIAIRKNIASAEKLIETKEAEADDKYLNIKINFSKSDTKITAEVIAEFPYVNGVIDKNKANLLFFEGAPIAIVNDKFFLIKDGKQVEIEPKEIKLNLEKPITTEDEKNAIKDIPETEKETVLEEYREKKGYITYATTHTFENLEPEKDYTITGLVSQKDFGAGSLFFWVAIYNATAGAASSGIAPLHVIRTNSKGDVTVQEAGSTQTSNSPDPMPACNLLNGALGGEGTFMGCIAQMFYYILFVPTSYVFALAGNIFDWIFAYSVDDDSYRSAFVVQGWGVLRDVCNIFFIFILLYIAFKTILNLKSGKTKELVVNVVIIGLFINFSLFTTRIIIDTSNILARVFYNSNTIQTTEGGANGVTDARADNNTTSSSSDSGVIPLSAGLVNKVNPQNLIINANKAVDHSSNVKSNGASTVDSTEGSEARITAGNFIIITILASIVNIVGIIVFISVAIFFVARVVGLWIMMIVSPLAFMSYAIPESQNISQIGWKKWWPETINLAFMAPVFIFFLYIILQFLETGLGVMEAGSGEKTGIAWVVGISVPFIFIMVLLNKAKDIAKKMSGELGQQIAAAASKAVSAVGGVALGAATGGAALAMRGTLGKAAGKLANSESLKDAASKGGVGGFMASKALKMGEIGSKSSFDVRNSKLGQTAGKEFNKQTGLSLSAGKGKTGGYVADVDRQVKKNDERAKRVEMSGEAAAEQDKKAKKWKEDYERAMFEDRAAFEAKPENKDKNYEESSFRQDYEQNKPKIKTSSEINSERMQSRKTAIENGKIKTGIIPNSDVKSRVISNLNSKISSKKESLTPREKYYLEKEKQETEIARTETLTKIGGNQNIMDKIASEHGLTNGADINADLVKESVDEKKDKIAIAQLKSQELESKIKEVGDKDLGWDKDQLENEYNSAQAEYNNIMSELSSLGNGERPSQDLENRNRLAEIRMRKATEQKQISDLKKAYIEKQAEIRNLETEAKEFSAVLENKKKLEELIEKQTRDIDKINEKLNGET